MSASNILTSFNSSPERDENAKEIEGIKKKGVYLNYTYPDSFFTAKPNHFDPKCKLNCGEGRHLKNCEPYRRSEHYLTSIPTLERLNIAGYDKTSKIDQLVVKHMEEYMPHYKKELKTVDVDHIKEVVFRKVYQEIVGQE